MKNVNIAPLIILIALGLICSGCMSSSMQQMKDNKALVRNMLAESDKQNWAELKGMHTPDFIYHLPGGAETRNYEGLEDSLRMTYEAFPDGYQNIEDIIAEDDKVVVRLTLYGTQKGGFFGIPASGKKVTISDTIIYRVENGKIAEAWEELDMMSLMRQLGAAPAM